MTVLLIDDDESINFLHQYILQKTGMFSEIKSVVHGSLALEILEELLPDNYPDLIFLDINMPGLNGWEFMEEYNKLPDIGRQKTSIVMISSSINPKDKEMAENYSNINSYITKPLNQRILNDVLRDLNFLSS